MKKKLLILLLALIMVLSCAMLIACKPDEPDNPNPDNPNPDNPNPPVKVLDNYIFAHEGKLLTDDITMPLQIGGKDVTWTSDNAAITIAKGAAAYTGTVTRGDETVTVKLTVTAGEENKTYEVRVKGIDIYDIADDFEFEQERATVVEDFDLVKEHTYLGKKATIKWSVEPAYSAYLEINATGDKCIVHQSSMNPGVRITAEFEYKNEKIKKEYMLTVSQQKTHAEEVDFWYKNENVAMALKGYIVAIADPYSEQYKNMSFYMIDEDFCSGYYVYRGSAAVDVGPTFKVGDYVEVSANVNSTYEGLYEVNQGATVTRGDKAALTQTQLDEKIYDLDNDLIAGSYNATKRQSTMVKVTKWLVKEVKTAPEAGKPGTMLVLEKDGKTVQVSSSKYIKGAYNHAADDETWKALVAKCSDASLKGKYVTVTGLLGCYKTLQIQPLNADAVVIEESGDEAAAYKDAHDAGLLIADINKMITDNKLNAIVTSAKDIVLPASKETATAVYEVMVNGEIVKVEAGNLKITPAVEEKINVKFTVTAGSYTVTDFFTVWSKNMSDAEKVTAEKITLRVGTVEDAGTIDLAKKGDVFTDVAITWAFKGDVADTLAKIENGKLVIVALPEEATTLTLVATLTCNEATATKEIKVAVPAWEPKVRITADKLGLGAYKNGTASFNGIEYSFNELGYYGNGIQMRISGEKVSTLWNTTRYPGSVESIDFVWAPGQSVSSDVENKMKIEFSKNNEFNAALTETKYLSLVKDQKNYTVEAPEGNFTYVRITINVAGGTYWNLICVNHDNTPVEDTPTPPAPPAEQIATEKEALTFKSLALNIPQSITLAAKGTTHTRVAITWAFKGEVADTLAKIENGKLVVVALPETATEVVVVATLTVTPEEGDAVTDTKEFTFTIAAENLVKADVENLSADTEYVLATDHTGLGGRYYAIAEASGNYVKTATDVANAATVKVEAVTDGYKLYFAKTDGGKLYINAAGFWSNATSKYASYKIVLSEDADTATVWTIEANAIKVVVNYEAGTGTNQNAGTETVFLTTSGTFDTISVTFSGNLGKAGYNPCYLATKKA